MRFAIAVLAAAVAASSGAFGPMPAGAFAAVGARTSSLALSLVPWTGAEPPGSISGTYKYRLTVTAAPNHDVSLHASRVPRGWVASFCSDRVCAPFHVTVAVPGSGVKVVEFQLVPPAADVPAPHVRVVARDAGRTSTAST